jgi:hypothetical protein
MKLKFILTIIITMGLFNILSGQKNLKQINVSEDSDFIDLSFTITKYWQDEHKNHICKVSGLWGNEIVGFEIAFRPDMRLGIIDGEVDKTRFYANGINLYSIGKESSSFIKALISLFKQNSTPTRMNDKITSTAFILGGNPENINSEYIKTKVFFDDLDENNLYSEWYINIDLKNKVLELREKDPEYRLNIVNILTK